MTSKKVAIMQPYFLPYIGYISLIKHSDIFILFDSVQFIRHGWIERNRILKQNEGWIYMQVPLIKNNSRQTLIKDCLIDNTQKWKEKILAQIQPYKKKAPYYYKVQNLVNKIFEQEYTDIVQLNKSSLEMICAYLGFEKKLYIFSQLKMCIDKPNAPDEWALNICKNIKQEYKSIHYINPIGGNDFFDVQKYERENIKISFQKMHLKEYNQNRSNFEPGLSILDVLMFNSPEEINIMLDQFELV